MHLPTHVARTRTNKATTIGGLCTVLLLFVFGILTVGSLVALRSTQVENKGLASQLKQEGEQCQLWPPCPVLASCTWLCTCRRRPGNLPPLHGGCRGGECAAEG